MDVGFGMDSNSGDVIIMSNWRMCVTEEARSYDRENRSFTRFRELALSR
jgi:hypothetical protein